jgi:hypothetical protein
VGVEPDEAVATPLHLLGEQVVPAAFGQVGVEPSSDLLELLKGQGDLRPAFALGELACLLVELLQFTLDGDAAAADLVGGGDDPLDDLPRQGIKAVREQVLQWTEKGGRLRPSQIAILTPQEPGGEWPKQIDTIPLSESFDRWRRGECILLSSHRRFKGLEADALILADVPVPERKHFSTADFYVACSRAKHQLTVVVRSGS